MMRLDTDLFGMPMCNPKLSQWMTPAWLARRLARWVPPGARVLEPGAGSGNLIDALLRQGHPLELITANEIDQRWHAHLKVRFPGLSLCTSDFLDRSRMPPFGERFDVICANPPFEEGLHAEFVKRALELAPLMITVAPVAIEFTGTRDREVWAPKARVLRRAKMPERVKYGGDGSPSFDSIALKIERRSMPRPQITSEVVVEEVWYP